MRKTAIRFKLGPHSQWEWDHISDYKCKSMRYWKEKENTDDNIYAECLKQILIDVASVLLANKSKIFIEALLKQVSYVLKWEKTLWKYFINCFLKVMFLRFKAAFVFLHIFHLCNALFKCIWDAFFSLVNIFLILRTQSSICKWSFSMGEIAF